jgi:hypothetical protein
MGQHCSLKGVYKAGLSYRHKAMELAVSLLRYYTLGSCMQFGAARAILCMHSTTLQLAGLLTQSWHAMGRRNMGSGMGKFTERDNLRRQYCVLHRIPLAQHH